MSILRRVMIEERNRLQGREKRSAAICETFLREYPNVKRVFLYVSFGSEVETHDLIHQLLAKGVEVLAPKMYGTNMRFFPIDSLDTLKKSPNGILEPSGSLREDAESPEYCDTDIMILPGVIFDEMGGRVGYGLGCYDRYLAEFPVHTVAFSYEMQIEDEPLTLKPSDQKYEALISEKRFIKL